MVNVGEWKSKAPTMVEVGEVEVAFWLMFPLTCATVWSMGAVLVRSALEPDSQDLRPVLRREGRTGLQSPPV